LSSKVLEGKVMGIRLTWLLMGLAGWAWADVGPLHPKYEGVYTITSLRCVDGSCGKLPDVAKLTVIDYYGGKVQVALQLRTIPMPKYVFFASSLTGDGAHIEGDGLAAMGRPVEWISDADQSGEEIVGRVRDGTLTGDIEVRAKRVFSPLPLYKTEPVAEPLALLDIQGVYDTNERVPGGDLILRASLSGNPPVIGTLSLGDGAYVDFIASEFFPEQGVLVLFANGAYGGALKWTVSLKRNAQGIVEGVAAAISSASGRYYTVKLRRPQRRAPRR
jgi:hypothetical protein